jgi:hypothetical protein
MKQDQFFEAVVIALAIAVIAVAASRALAF